MASESVVVLLSGGLDSSAVVAHHRSLGNEVYAISFMYGQKTVQKEIQCSREICAYYQVREHQVVDLDFLTGFLKSGLMDKGTDLTTENKLAMYVPFRNSLFLSFGVAWAESIGATRVSVGSHQTGPICPDNSPEFINAFQSVVELGTLKKPPILIDAPFVNMRKAQLVQNAIDLKVPFEHTWSCFNTLEYACGICPNCLDRLRAFKACNFKDPIPYDPALPPG